MDLTSRMPPASIADCAVLERALQLLVKGDPWPVTRLLSPNVEWRATAQRNFAQGLILDSGGARRYLSQMASAIASGAYKLEVVSLALKGPDIVAVTVWTDSDGKTRQECANVVRFQGGQVVSVLEQA